jgi:2-polyprenyl-3-methyl-5-hydroxy-6-metoxy-1,4-benzoquinol methylase
MELPMSWARKRAVAVHNETAGYFSTEYASDNVYNSPFRYGRALIDAQWNKVVEGLPAGADCLDIGSGIGTYMARLLQARINVRGIEPSAEMRKLAQERVPSGLVSDGSVTDLAADDRSQNFIYAIEVFRYLDAADNALGHREIFRALKPGGMFFGTYVNEWALDFYRQFVALEKLCNAVLKTAPRYHVEFETVSTLEKKLAAAGFKQIEIRGAMFAPLRPLHKLSSSLATSFSRWTLPREGWLSEGAISRQFAGHLIAIARREP